ncbi:heme ABC transporter permease [Sesbania bispinosa]|nr:heme ABC transporter permease [Sesbania bispinosa]
MVLPKCLIFKGCPTAQLWLRLQNDRRMVRADRRQGKNQSMLEIAPPRPVYQHPVQFSLAMKSFLGLLVQVNLHPFKSSSIRPMASRKSLKRLVAV